jgi:hypothetical protein
MGRKFEALDWEEKMIYFRLLSLAYLAEATGGEHREPILTGISGILEDIAEKVKAYLCSVRMDGREA